MVKKISIWIMGHRFIVLGTIFILTIFFASQVFKMEIKTQFEDLLPQNHPFIKVHNKYEKQLGAPFKVFLMLKVKEGDIYNQETLRNAQEITDKLDLIPGVNHNQVYSIGSRKVKKRSITANGIITENFMDRVPETDEEMEEFKETVYNTRGVYGIWVSRDEKSLLFSAAFIPDRVDINVLFEKIGELKQSYSDSNHDIYVAGEPILTGWVYFYQKEMYWIFGVTFTVLIFLLYFYFRNLVGVVVPTLATLIGGIWGLGFSGLLGYNLEPLTLVIPLLIAARALCHSVQIIERYFECYAEYREVNAACIESTSSILPPGTLGIATDGIGILLIAVAPIPIMQKLAFVCAFWAFTIIITGIIFTPVLVSFFKPPKNLTDIVDMTKGMTQKLLGLIARLGFGKAGVTTFIGAVLLFAMTGWIASKINIGDINPGTPILWPDSEYNVAISKVNEGFPGTEELYVIVEGNGKGAITEPEFLDILDSFQRHMEKNSRVSATLSVKDFLPSINRNIFGGYFKWEIVPTDPIQVGQLFYVLMGQSAPEDFDLYFSRDTKDANVVIWFKDHTGDTIREAVSWITKFIKEKKDDLAKVNATFQLASGNIGVLAAINETVQKSQILNITLVTLAIFLFCSITYRSIMAAVILMIPLNLTNLITLSIMKGMGIGLNINTLPIISVGVGVGIDYGVYLLSRLCEEYRAIGEYSFATADKTIRTTGKAIFFTSAAMIAGVIFWYFLSSMRFQAEMGLLLAIIMFLNMIGSLVLVPSLVYVFKPKFLGRAKLLLK